MEKVTGYKKAVGTFNDWVGHAKIMYDSSDKTVWCDVFASCSEWDNYHNEDIVCLVSKGEWRMDTNWDKTTMAEVLEEIENI